MHFLRRSRYIEIQQQVLYAEVRSFILGAYEIRRPTRLKQIRRPNDQLFSFLKHRDCSLRVPKPPASAVIVTAPPGPLHVLPRAPSFVALHDEPSLFLLLQYHFFAIG